VTNRLGRRRNSVDVVLASAFAVLFTIFVVALGVLCVVIVTWAIRRDRSSWREWRERQGR
jgi:hypothetical protein